MERLASQSSIGSEMGKDDSIGLVLAGGGAKGAFQAGVWKAMCRLGLADRVKFISGTSVGAINAAAFAAIRDPEKVCSFWRTRVSEVVTPNFQALSFDAFRRAAENVIAGKAFPFHGLLDRKVIEDMIRWLLPLDWPRDAPQVTATALECRGGILEELDSSAYRLRRFRLEEEPDHQRRVAKILASAAIPWGFDPVEIDGRRYVDGGWDEKGGENVPAAPLLKVGDTLGTLVVVRCNSREIEPESHQIHTRRKLQIVEIRPSTTLRGIFDGLSDFVPDAGFMSDIPFVGPLADSIGDVGRTLRSWSGVFAFNSDCVRQFIQQGYADGMAALRQLRSKERLNW